MRNQKDIALDAIELVKPAIMNLFERTCRKELHIVVMDPTIKPWEAKFEDAILVEDTTGTPAEWTAPFDELARKKAQQAWRDGVANINHQTQHPASLREGDILYFGSFVYGNIVVGCSGVEPYYDMLISSWVALAFEQLTIAEYQIDKIETPKKAFR
ncbi:hypothetical protein ACR30L_03270 [Psychromonas sp. PT13]|uniref:hypothetical protein n=1 Tax=Psychromonas sp. PT13 TaxID=3439547 RepID=UPI003EBE4903